MTTTRIERLIKRAPKAGFKLRPKGINKPAVIGNKFLYTRNSMDIIKGREMER